MQPTKTNERGITLIALLIMIIILTILTAVILRTITGDEPIIGTTAETAEDYKIVSYKEEISHVVHSEIISKSAIGETATTGDIADNLNEQDWVKVAYVNENAKAEVGNITVQVKEGYVYQVYYNSIYGKIEIDYIGKDIDDLNSFTLIARYEKSPASIYATAQDKKHGIAKIEIIYKEEVRLTKNNPSGEQKFDISEIGTGWYKVKATSNSGAIKYEWVRATNISDKLTIPEITIETESKITNGWYIGKNEQGVAKDVYFKISTKSPSAKEIIYTLSGATVKGEIVEALPEVSEGEEKSIRIKIENCGPTNIMAVTSDGVGYESEPNGETVKYDNIPPRITTSTENQIEGTAGQNGWYISPEVKITVEAEDPPAGILDGYVYRITNEITKQTTQETHQKDITKQITIEEDGEYTVYVEAIDQAGNKSPTRTLQVKKDSIRPTVGTPQVTDITETSMQVTIGSYRDDTSKVAYFEYYLNGNKAKTDIEAITTIEELTPNQNYSVTVIAYDNAGNPSQESDTVPTKTKGELKAPDIQITGNTRNGYYIGDVTIQVTDTAESTKTRVARIKVTGAGEERTITGTSGSFTITTDGTYTISAWSEDAQGNKSDTTTKQAFTRDSTAPSAPIISPTSTTWQKGNVTVTITPGTDNTSGIYGVRYSVTGAKTVAQKDVATTTNTTQTIDVNGESTVTAYTIDKAGNVSSAKTQVIKRDNTAPTPTLGTPTTNSSGTIKVTATANESGGSGVKSYEFQYKEAGGNWTRKEVKTSTASTYTYTYTGMGDGKTVYIRVLVTDNAGNIGKSATDSSNGTSAVIPSANTAPVVETITYKSKTTNSITVEAMATDVEKDELTYRLYIRRKTESN